MKHDDRAERTTAPWYLDTAMEHAWADARCNRAWVCACGACRTARKNGIELTPKISREKNPSDLGR